MSRFLVTGGDGFIGSHLVRRLMLRGDVTVVEKPGSQLRRLQAWERDLRIVRVDVRDKDGVSEAIRDSRANAVFHLAAAGVVPGEHSPEEMMAVNVLGTYNVLAAILTTGSVERSVFVGSWYEYGDSLGDGASRFPRPTSAYGVSKLAGTRLVQSFASEMQLPAVVVRPFQVYGPFEYPHRLIPHVIRSVRDRVPVRLENPVAQRDWAYVEDVAAALECAGQAKCIGDVVDVGTGVLTSVARVTAMVLESLGHEAVGTDPLRPPTEGNKVPDGRLSGAADTRLAGELFDWRATCSLEEGVRKTVEWHRREGSL